MSHEGIQANATFIARKALDDKFDAVLLRHYLNDLRQHLMAFPPWCHSSNATHKVGPDAIFISAHSLAIVSRMGKRRADATGRRFTDEFPSVRVSRFRANGTIDPAKRSAIIAFPDGSTKLIGVGHTRFPSGGGWSFFSCPGCAKLAQTLYSINDKALCWRCCDKLNIRHRGKWGMGREERLRAADQQLDRIIAKLETTKSLRLNGAPTSWGGKAQLVYRSRRLTQRMRRSMITLRLSQLASQHANADGSLNLTREFTPRKDALAAIPGLKQVWRARTHERLQQALDNIQCALLKALESNDPHQRLIAAHLMLKTKQARERGFRT